MEKEIANNDNKPQYAPPPQEEIDFWRELGQSWISNSLSQLDSRAKWMVTTIVGITIADSTLLQIIRNVTLVSITPNLFFAFSILFFIASLFPTKGEINPNMTYVMMDTYESFLQHKIKWSKLGYATFFIGLIFLAITTLFPAPTTT